MSYTLPELNKMASEIRSKIIEMSHYSRAAHLGSALSCVDILVAAYFHGLKLNPVNPSDPLRDRFILSKGHAALGLYVTLARRGFISDEMLQTFGEPGSQLEEHPGPNCAPGVEAATGSLGHGLSIGTGMALAGKITQQPYRVCTLLSDGECNEGSVWEAAMFAPSHQLENVMAIVDFNKWQATGRSCDVLALESLTSKWQAFGWSIYEIDGHDMKALIEIFSNYPDGSGKPVAVIAHTVKGKGVSFMEDDNNWHYRIPTEEEVEKSKIELGVMGS